VVAGPDSLAPMACLSGLDGWGEGLRLRFASAFAAASESAPDQVSVRVTRAGGPVAVLPSAHDNVTRAVAAPRAYMSEYNARTCEQLSGAAEAGDVDADAEALPPVAGCYRVEFFDADARGVGLVSTAGADGAASAGLVLVLDVTARTAAPLASPPRASRYSYVDRAKTNPLGACALLGLPSSTPAAPAAPAALAALAAPAAPAGNTSAAGAQPGVPGLALPFEATIAISMVSGVVVLLAASAACKLCCRKDAAPPRSDQPDTAQHPGDQPVVRTAAAFTFDQAGPSYIV
jgi:hypothetical protein